MNTKEKCEKLYERFKKVKEESKDIANTMGLNGSYTRINIDSEKVHEQIKIEEDMKKLNCDKVLNLNPEERFGI